MFKNVYLMVSLFFLTPHYYKSIKVGDFPDGQFAFMLVDASPRHIAAIRRGTLQYLSMERLAINRISNNIIIYIDMELFMIITQKFQITKKYLMLFVII